MNLIINPENKYHKQTTPGPPHPTSSESFFENKTISSVGLVKFEYISERELAHFYMSEVNL
jgi:hypothetical protein